MEKMVSATEMIEADYRLLCQARQEAVVRPTSWKRRAIFYFAVLLLLSFPVFF